MSDHREDFGLFIDFVDFEVILRVRGDVDVQSAPILRAFLATLSDQGYAAVVLDFDELNFIDCAGYGVIASEAGHLRSLGGSLTIRQPSRIVTRTLNVLGLAHLSEFVNLMHFEQRAATR